MRQYICDFCHQPMAENLYNSNYQNHNYYDGIAIKGIPGGKISFHMDIKDICPKCLFAFIRETCVENLKRLHEK